MSRARQPERPGDIIIIEHVDGTARFAVVITAVMLRATEAQRFDGRYVLLRRMYHMRLQGTVALKDTHWVASGTHTTCWGAHPDLQRLFASTAHAQRALMAVRTRTTTQEGAPCPK